MSALYELFDKDIRSALETCVIHYEVCERTPVDELSHIAADELASLRARLAAACHVKANDKVDFDLAVLDKLAAADAMYAVLDEFNRNGFIDDAKAIETAEDYRKAGGG